MKVFASDIAVYALLFFLLTVSLVNSDE